MRSTIRTFNCLIILTAFMHLVFQLDVAHAGTVAPSAGSTVSGKRNTERPQTDILIWDTQSPFVDKVDLRDRTDWKVVPSNLLMLETKPTAMSDPAYYGREYYFKADVVVENEHLMAVFSSKKGHVAIYSKTDSSQKKVEVIPLQLKGKPAGITNNRILQNTGDLAALEITFSARNSGDNYSAVFSFDSKQIVGIKPDENMKGISLISPIEYGVVPGFIGDDLIFNPGNYPSKNTLCVPSDNLFLGLLRGRNDMLAITWPFGNQQTRLVLDNKENKGRLIESVDFENDGQSLYIALLEAPGIWHKEDLKPSYLEKDVAIDWKRPFPAVWKTQLLEAGVNTTYKFKESKSKIWRAIAGHYTYPVWFEGEKTFYRLGKKIPPKGESIIYFLERKGTPLSISTPVDIMRETLGRRACDNILDFAGRKLRSHHRRAGQGVRRAATCGCTEAIEVVFKAGREVEKREYVTEAVDDMVYFVTRHVERIGEYQDFARDMTSFMNLQSKSHPDLKPFLDSMNSIIQQIPEEYNRQKENIKTLEYAAELARKTKALTKKENPQNLQTFLDLSAKWRVMGGAQDELLGRFHSITRNLFQEAGYSCVDHPRALEIARDIRSRCRKCLRNPDGYEIWPDY